MIPKKIHYCWFGGTPLPKSAIKCINSWRKYFPDYEIIEWNESNFDVNQNKYAKEAYEAKKYAFVSDYARFKILHENGGFYFDTDVEVIKPFNDIKTPHLGIEMYPYRINPGLGMSAEKGSKFCKLMVNMYDEISFLNEDGSLNLKTIVDYTSDNLMMAWKIENSDKGNLDYMPPVNLRYMVMDMNIYPKEYFNPFDWDTGRYITTEKTHSIHHFAASWEKKSRVLKGKIYRYSKRIFGKSIIDRIRDFVICRELD